MIPFENVYCYFSHRKDEPSDAGRQQFHDLESRGIRPDPPDPYFARLVDGKFSFNFVKTEMFRAYGTEHWHGWAQVEQDYAPWVWPHLFKGFPVPCPLISR